MKTFSKKRGEIVSHTFLEDEKFYRCVKHPYHYNRKKRRFKRAIFLPKENATDISMLRERYTLLDEAIIFGRTLAKENEEFVGIASLLHKDIINLNALEEFVLKAHPIYAPMHNGKYVTKEIVYTNDPDISLPGHIELRYNTPYTKNDDVINTQYRKYADKLCDFLNQEYIE